MNLIPAIRFAIFISNGLKFYLAHDFLPKESEIAYEFTVFRLETKILLRNIYPVFPPQHDLQQFPEDNIFIHISFIYWKIFDRWCSSQINEMKKSNIFFRDIIRVQELRRVEWNEYRWLE